MWLIYPNQKFYIDAIGADKSPIKEADFVAYMTPSTAPHYKFNIVKNRYSGYTGFCSKEVIEDYFKRFVLKNGDVESNSLGEVSPVKILMDLDDFVRLLELTDYVTEGFISNVNDKYNEADGPYDIHKDRMRRAELDKAHKLRNMIEKNEEWHEWINMHDEIKKYRKSR